MKEVRNSYLVNPCTDARSRFITRAGDTATDVEFLHGTSIMLKILNDKYPIGAPIVYSYRYGHDQSDICVTVNENSTIKDVQETIRQLKIIVEKMQEGENNEK